MGKKKRSSKEIEFDRNFAIRQWLDGFKIREIQTMLEQEHTAQGNPYKPSLMMISRDISNIIKETRIQREKSGIDILEGIIMKYEQIYNDSMLAQRMGDPFGRKDAKSILDSIAKLRGLFVEKQEINLRYDIEIE